MKRIISSIILLTVLFTGCKKFDYDEEDYPKKHLVDSVTVKPNIQLPISKKWNELKVGDTTVEDGDSFTEGYGRNDPRSYPSQLARLTGLIAINRGTGGRDQVQIKDTFMTRPDLFNKFHFIWSGRNNNWNTQSILDNVEAMTSKIKDSAYIVIGLLSGDWPIEYVTDTVSKYGTNHNMQWWTTVFPDSLLEVRHRGHFFSPQPFFKQFYDKSVGDSIDKAHGIISRRYRSDELHLNDLGYRMLVDTLIKMIRVSKN